MSITTSLQISAIGIHRNIERFNAGAAAMSQPRNVGRVQPLVDMMVAKHGVQANINTFKAAAQMGRAALDIVA